MLISLPSYYQSGVSIHETIRLANFGAGEQGAMLIPIPVIDGQQILYQDLAGSIPVTADSQPVRVIKDFSGNGNNALAPSDAARYLYRTDGTLHWLERDFVDDRMDIPLSITSSDVITQCWSYDNAGENMIFFHTPGASTNWALIAQSGSTNTGLSSATTQNSLYVDGVLSGATTRGEQFDLLNPASVAVQEFTAGYSNLNYAIGIHDTGAFSSPKMIYGHIAVKGTLTAEKRQQLNDYLAQLKGVTL